MVNCVYVQINGSTEIVLTFNKLLNLQGNYIQGNLGEDACPTGYYPILGQDECEAAANYFGYDFPESPINAAVDENSVLFFEHDRDIACASLKRNERGRIVADQRMTLDERKVHVPNGCVRGILPGL